MEMLRRRSGGRQCHQEVDSVGYWVELDLTGVVQDWVSGDAANYGLKLTQPNNVRDNTNTSVFALFSSDGAASNRPELVINSVPEPSTYLLLGGAARCSSLSCASGRRLGWRHPARFPPKASFWRSYRIWLLSQNSVEVLRRMCNLCAIALETSPPAGQQLL